MKYVKILKSDWLASKMKPKNRRLMLNSPYYHLGKLRQRLQGEDLEILNNLEVTLDKLEVKVF